MSRHAPVEDPEVKPEAPAPAPAQQAPSQLPVQDPAYPFAAPEAGKSEAKQKEENLEKAFEAYRAKISEDGRPIRAFAQLDAADRQEFADTGKLAEVEIGRAPNWIHARRNPDGKVVLVTGNHRSLYVATGKDAVPGTLFEPIHAGTASAYGNFSIDEGFWAYKGARLYTSTLSVPPPFDAGFAEALA